MTQIVPTSAAVTASVSAYDVTAMDADEVQATNNGPSSTGLIVGVVIGVAVLVSVIVVVFVILYRKNQKTMGMYARQLAMIDLSAINLGEAKSSIVSDAQKGVEWSEMMLRMDRCHMTS